MSETAGAENVIPQTSENENGGVADNPAWSDFLGAIPESMHDMVKPHLRKWDDGVNSRIQQVHAEYADFKPYRDAGITSEILNQAYGIYQAIDADPRKVYDLLGETYGYAANPQNQPNVQGQLDPQQQQQQQQNNQGTGSDEYDLAGGQFNPELARYQQMTETMAKMLIEQENARLAAQADAELDASLKAARDKYGDFNEKFVMGMMQSGFSMDDGIKAYQEMANQILSNANRPGAPTVISGQGSTAVPSNQVNVSKLNTSDTRALVANMMRAANQQG